MATRTGQSIAEADDTALTRPQPTPLTTDELATLREIEQRMLWISTAMIHHANSVRPSSEKSKVGGHQASSASVSTIMTALYFHFLQEGDRVSIKPHASPIYHAAQYLLGRLDRSYLTTLREFKGLQAYPSRTKDPDPVDFSTGSVGLGAVAPAFAALAHRYAELHFGSVTSNRFLALIGDAELDEGNIWEAVAEEALRGLSNVIWIIDLNRQSLDRVIPGVRAGHLKALFAGAGWRVFEAKYGSKLQAAMDGSPNDALRRRIDEMSNEEYQALIRIRNGADLRTRLTDVADATWRRDLIETLAPIADDDLQEVVSNLGGHDLPRLIDVLNAADAVDDAPSVIFAYTIKGFGLPLAGDPLNHSLLLTQDQMDTVRTSIGIDADDPWAVFPEDTAAAELCRQSSARLGSGRTTGGEVPVLNLPVTLDTRNPSLTSTQEALGRVLSRLADFPELRERIITMSPDVATSTHLSGWINKVGVFSPEETHDFEESAQRMLKWLPNPSGQHIELGISEMNLFMALSQFGLAQELTGQHLIPIGTVYDPFVCRGLDALIYGLYIGARMIFAGTPAGVSLSPEGGAHQSTVTPSLGIELPGVRFYEPAFAHEVEWLLLDAIDRCGDRANGSSTYLRLSTKGIDHSIVSDFLAQSDTDTLRADVLSGGYRLIDWQTAAPDLAAADVVQIAVAGIMVPEAVAAAKRLHAEGVAANVLVITSAERLFTDLRESRRSLLRNASGQVTHRHLDRLIPRGERKAPIVTIQDGSSHSLAFLGSVWGVPVVPLGVDEFGQSGTRADLYRQTGIDADAIVNAAMLSLDLLSN